MTRQSAAIARGTVRTLLLLCLVNMFTIGDRLLLGILQEPIKHEFALSDFELGLLGGPAFAILYGVLNLPTARLAERMNRVTIIAVCIGLFSAMTASCGLAASYIQLLLARMGVSVGEAGTSPAALSLISDTVPLERRTSAMAVFGMGGPAGGLVAMIGGGWIAQHHGWRPAFWAFGAGGLIVAVAIAMLLNDPRKAAPVAVQRTGFLADLGVMARNRSFRHLCIVNLVGAFCSTFILQYLTSFLIRAHGLDLGQAALIVGVVLGVAGIIGTLAGGWAADRLSRHRPEARLWIGGAGMLVAAIGYAAAVWVPLVLAVPLLLVAALGMSLYPAVGYSASVSVVPARMRATAVALFLLAGILFGSGLGPPILGAISDGVAAGQLRGSALSLADCATRAADPVCLKATGQGLRWALSIGGMLIALGALHMALASRDFAQRIAEADQN